ncbi:hypothetical protein ABKN59_008829 [Abortiporus biennis]
MQAEGAPSSSLSGFSFSVIGKQPSLLGRISLLDTTQDLQTDQFLLSSSPPLSPSQSPATERLPLQRPSLLEALSGVDQGTESPTLMPASQHNTISEVSDRERLRLSSPQLSSPPPVSVDIPMATARTQVTIPHTSDPINPLLPQASRKSKASPTVQSQSQQSTEPNASSAAPNRSSTQWTFSHPLADWYTTLGDLAKERAAWDEIRILRQRYRDEYQEFQRRHDETVRMAQREKDQADRVVAAVESVFDILDSLIVKQEPRWRKESAMAELAISSSLQTTQPQPVHVSSIQSSQSEPSSHPHNATSFPPAPLQSQIVHTKTSEDPPPNASEESLSSNVINRTSVPTPTHRSASPRISPSVTDRPASDQSIDHQIAEETLSNLTGSIQPPSILGVSAQLTRKPFVDVHHQGATATAVIASGVPPPSEVAVVKADTEADDARRNAEYTAKKQKVLADKLRAQKEEKQRILAERKRSQAAAVSGRAQSAEGGKKPPVSTSQPIAAASSSLPNSDIPKGHIAAPEPQNIQPSTAKEAIADARAAIQAAKSTTLIPPASQSIDHEPSQSTVNTVQKAISPIISHLPPVPKSVELPPKPLPPVTVAKQQRLKLTKSPQVQSHPSNGSVIKQEPATPTVNSLQYPDCGSSTNTDIRGTGDVNRSDRFVQRQGGGSDFARLPLSPVWKPLSPVWDPSDSAWRPRSPSADGTMPREEFSEPTPFASMVPQNGSPVDRGYSPQSDDAGFVNSLMLQPGHKQVDSWNVSDGGVGWNNDLGVPQYREQPPPSSPATNIRSLPLNQNQNQPRRGEPSKARGKKRKHDEHDRRSEIDNGPRRLKTGPSTEYQEPPHLRPYYPPPHPPAVDPHDDGWPRDHGRDKQGQPRYDRPQSPLSPVFSMPHGNYDTRGGGRRSPVPVRNNTHQDSQYQQPVGGGRRIHDTYYPPSAPPVTQRTPPSRPARQQQKQPAYEIEPQGSDRDDRLDLLARMTNPPRGSGGGRKPEPEPKRAKLQRSRFHNPHPPNPKGETRPLADRLRRGEGLEARIS